MPQARQNWYQHNITYYEHNICWVCWVCWDYSIRLAESNICFIELSTCLPHVGRTTTKHRVGLQAMSEGCGLQAWLARHGVPDDAASAAAELLATAGYDAAVLSGLRHEECTSALREHGEMLPGHCHRVLLAMRQGGGGGAGGEAEHEANAAAAVPGYDAVKAMGNGLAELKVRVRLYPDGTAVVQRDHSECKCSAPLFLFATTDQPPVSHRPFALPLPMQTKQRWTSWCGATPPSSAPAWAKASRTACRGSPAAWTRPTWTRTKRF